VTDDRLNNLRDELRARGYLSAPVDRFVLGGAMKQARPAGIAIAASIRIGLLTGVLLGPAAAIGLRSRLPGLVTSTTDAVVVSVYLAVLFWIAGAIVSGVAVMLGAAVARRVASSGGSPRRFQRAAAAAGLLVGLACLAYLTLWWSTASGLAGSTSTGSSLAVIGVAVVISLLLGHAVAVTVLACLVRLGLVPEGPHRRPLSSLGTLLPLGVVAGAGAFALLVVSGSNSAEAPEPPRLTVVPTGVRVVVLAVDGIDPATLDRLRGSGHTPNFGRLLSQGVAALRPDPDRDPARVWTTVATGQPPERHGIRALESRQVAGLGGRVGAGASGWGLLVGATDLIRLTRPAIASGNERLIPTFWEVAAHAGFRTAVVHWWATWPAPPDAGIVLSDRAILRLEHAGDLDAEIAPPALFGTLQTTWPARRTAATDRAARLSIEGVSADTASLLRRSAELDATIALLAADKSLGGTDLLAVYLPGLDIAQSALFGGTGLAPSSAAERVLALDRYYEFVDGLLGDVLAAQPAGDRLDVLVTQPGRAGATAAGQLALSGRFTRMGRTDAIAPTAIAPTILHALGLPVATDLPDRPVTALFDEAFNAAHRMRVVETYGSRLGAGRSRAGQSLDREMIDRMRSLGYVR
jgi:hypothetical protein